jgi:hypothetical protein
MRDQEKSDSAIVAVKPSNKAGTPAAEAVEPRAGTKGNADQQSTHRTRHTPEVGAGCSNWARPDLCGGRPAMDVPTANLGGKPTLCRHSTAEHDPTRTFFWHFFGACHLHG